LYPRFSKEALSAAIGLAPYALLIRAAEARALNDERTVYDKMIHPVVIAGEEQGRGGIRQGSRVFQLHDVEEGKVGQGAFFEHAGYFITQDTGAAYGSQA
jgi:hypothetical protein